MNKLRKKVADILQDKTQGYVIHDRVTDLITLIRTATLDEVKPIELALKALVELKDYKDEFGKTTYYIQRQPVVWNDARRAIDNLRGK